MQDKWQQKYNAKKHQERLQNAKSTLNRSCKSGKTKSSYKGKDGKDNRDSVSKNSSSKGSIFDSQSNLSDFTIDERQDIHRIPLYGILRVKGLQQYTKSLVARGYGYCIEALALIEDNLFEELLDEIKTLPGHQNKFKKLREELLTDLKFKEKSRKIKRFEEEGKQYKIEQAQKISKEKENHALDNEQHQMRKSRITGIRL